MSPRPQEIGIRRADESDHEVVAEALALAFVDDPAWAWLLRDPRERGDRLLEFFNSELRHMVPEHLEVWTTEDGAAAAAWAPPGRWGVPFTTILREVPTMLRIFGRRLPLATRQLLKLERLHPRRPEHWYLHYLGAVPERQGQGLGSALMRPMLEHCDEQGLPAYLESSTE